tara:strand:+ start:360 stop:497 length:138 start_codon:yes stop_codon:yes gene_type:complete
VSEQAHEASQVQEEAQSGRYILHTAKHAAWLTPAFESLLGKTIDL